MYFAQPLLARTGWQCARPAGVVWISLASSLGLQRQVRPHWRGAVLKCDVGNAQAVFRTGCVLSANAARRHGGTWNSNRRCAFFCTAAAGRGLAIQPHCCAFFCTAAAGQGCCFNTSFFSEIRNAWCWSAPCAVMSSDRRTL